MDRDHRRVKERIISLKRKWAQENAVCHLCKGPIDYSLKSKTPYSVEADDFLAVANGGNVLGPMFASHRVCNQRRGKKDVDEYITEQINGRVHTPSGEIPEVKRPLLW
jgi:hypothetical protein